MVPRMETRWMEGANKFTNRNSYKEADKETHIYNMVPGMETRWMEGANKITNRKTKTKYVFLVI